METLAKTLDGRSVSSYVIVNDVNETVGPLFTNRKAAERQANGMRVMTELAYRKMLYPNYATFIA